MVHRTVRRHQRPVSFLKLSWYWQLWGYLIRTQRPEMLVNYRWIWSQLSWQISRLTFTSKHIQFRWFYLLHPANEARIPSNFSPVNCISKQHQCANITLWDTSSYMAMISKQITGPYIASGFGYFAFQLSCARYFAGGSPTVSCEISVRSAI